MKLTWLDLTDVAVDREAVVQEALNHGIDGLLSEEVQDLADLPSNVMRVLLARSREDISELENTDIVVVGNADRETVRQLAQEHPDVSFGRYVEIVDAPTLQDACDAAREDNWALLRFADPTKIPLEIVLAAADDASGSIVTKAEDITEAEIIFGVLERGSDGVLLAPTKIGDATELQRVAQEASPPLDLVELTVTSVEHVGMGERACVDTCTQFREDEGILVGSRASGMILCVSETHPLPYMPTRPFRVNAGAIHSYTISTGGRTNYLSELRAGHKITAVDVAGKTRTVTVGRVKIETRPLLSIEAESADCRSVNLILQDDWHVRVLGPGAAVMNSTELKAGDKVLGYLPSARRHVGYPIDEFCIEQ